MQNNIIVTNADGAPYGCYNCDSFNGDYNLIYNTTFFPFLGANDIIGEDPLFRRPSSNPTIADFSLLDGSPALNAAFANNSAPFDFFGNRRKITPDLGAIERMNEVVADCDAGAVFGTSDKTIFFICSTNTDTTTNNLSFFNSSADYTNYAYIITDAMDNIIAVEETTYDFEPLNSGLFFVYGISYEGELEVSVGETINTISSANDSIADLVIFQQAISSNLPVIFFLLDDAGIVLDIDDRGFELEGTDVGTYLVGAATYTGDLIIEKGISIDDQSISNDCFAYSLNFVTINNQSATMPSLPPPPVLDGGQIMIVNGQQTMDLCLITTSSSELTFAHNTTSVEQYAYVVIDEADIIVDISTAANIDFANLDCSICLVGGVSYTGNITATVGDEFSDIVFSDADYIISEEKVQINRIPVDGGTISTLDGQGAFDFNPLMDGIYFIHGLNYVGNLIAEIGRDIHSQPLADGCFELSNGRIEVNRMLMEIMVDGGQITSATEQTAITYCGGTGQNEFISIQQNSNGLGDQYNFIITNVDNQLIEILETDSISFESITDGVYLIKGVSYAGAILAEIGDNLDDVPFASGNFAFSENEIEVTRISVDGGTITTLDGVSSIEISTLGEETVDIIEVTNNRTTEGNYTYLLTDEANLVLDMIADGAFDFNPLMSGTYFIYGLNYVGDLTVQIGEDIYSQPLTDGCFELSDATIEVNRILMEVIVDGGQITSATEQAAITLCVGAGQDDFISVQQINNGLGDQYRFIITDIDNQLIEILETDSISPFASGNFAFSENAIEVTRTGVDGGVISTLDGQSIIEISTLGEETADIIEVVNNRMTEGNYTYLLTDERDLVLKIVADGSFDFNPLPDGTYFIYGLNYVGNLIAETGENIYLQALADGCFELSNANIPVNRISEEVTVDGGQITSSTEQTSFRLCVGAGQNEFVRVRQNNNGIGDQYKFIITDADNHLLEIMETDSTSFESAPDGVCFIKGVSYGGVILAKVGDNLNDAPFASGNFAFSENAIEVTRIGVDGGHISATTGETEVSFCEEDDVSDTLQVNITTTSDKPYALTVIDGEGNLLDIIDGKEIDFSKYSRGFYFIRGVSYTGDVFIELGQDQSLIPFSTGCFNHSNSVQVYWVGTSPDCLTSLNDLDQYQFEMRLSPNPAQEKVTIEFDNPSGNNENGLIEIYNLNGQLIYQQPLRVWSEANSVAIDVANYAEGLYMAKIQLGNFWGYQKFVKGN